MTAMVRNRGRHSWVLSPSGPYLVLHPRLCIPGTLVEQHFVVIVAVAAVVVVVVVVVVEVVVVMVVVVVVAVVVAVMGV